MHAVSLIITVVTVAGFVIAVLYMRVMDTPARRRYVANHLQQLGVNYLDEPSKESLDRLFSSAAHPGDRFRSCYAITVVSRVALDALEKSDEKRRSDAASMVLVLSDRLASEDPFVRHAAAEAFYRLGALILRVQDDAKSAAQDALERTARTFENESSGFLAASALEILTSAAEGGYSSSPG